MNTVILGVGSNIHPLQNIEKAKRLIKERYPILAESTFKQTKPVGFSNQPNFINGALLVKTWDNISKIKKLLKSIEQSLGRRHSKIKFGPRPIDLDILVFNNKILDKDFYTRDFLREAVLELIPELKY